MFIIMQAALVACNSEDNDRNPSPTSSQVTATIPTNSLSVNNMTPANKPIQTDVIVIQGIFDPKGENLLELQPIRQYRRLYSPTSYRPVGYFAVIVVYADKSRMSFPFDALISSDAPNGTQHGFFEVEIPVSGTIDVVLITDDTQQTMFAEIQGTDIILGD
jgi:hypothetical protein